MSGSSGALVPKKVRGFLWLGCQGQLAGKEVVATVPCRQAQGQVRKVVGLGSLKALHPLPTQKLQGTPRAT